MKPGGGTIGAAGCLVLALAMLATLLSTRQPVYAESGWSAAEVVFRTTGYLARPRLVADASGDVHLFFYLKEEVSANGEDDAPRAIMYSRLHDGAWSHPADILVTTTQGLESHAVAVDGQGVLHVIWQGGANGELIYSQAHVTQAATTRSWSQPRPISDTPALDSHIAVSDDNMLHVVYADRSRGVWYRSSNDSGLTWSSPAAVVHGRGAPCAANHPHVAADGHGMVHVVWTTFQLPGGWPPCGAFYSDSRDAGRTWASSVRIAGPGYGQINLALTGPSTVVLAWNAMVAIGERKFTWSTDGGFSWRHAARFAPQLRGGFTGVPSIAADGAGMIHVVTSVDRQHSAVQEVYHLAWDGVRWTEPVLLSAGAIGARSVEMPWLTTSNGNRLHAVFEDDFKRIWYSTRLTAAPPIAPRALPAPSLPAPSTPVVAAAEPTATNRATAEPRVEPPTDTGLFSQSRNPFLLGVFAVAILLAGIVLIRVLQRTRG